MDEAERNALAERGYAALEEGELDNAEEVAARLREADPADAEGYALMADVLLSRDQVEPALELLEEGIKASKGTPLLLGARASVLLDVFEDPVGARQDLERALAAGPDELLRADLKIMLAEVCLVLQDPAAALQVAQETATELEEAPEPHLLAGQALFDLHRFDEALKALARSLDRDPHLAPAFFTRGEILELQGQAEEAERAFERARTIDPESFPKTLTVSTETFEQIVAEAIDELPEVVAEYLHNVAVVVEELPDLGILRESDPPLSPACFGLFEGTPRPVESSSDPWSTLPKAVRLYRRNILRSCADLEDVREVVATTLLHEIGHFLGLDEDDLVERGLQ